MPLIVPMRYWHERLLERSTVALVFLAVLGIASAIILSVWDAGVKLDPGIAGEAPSEEALGVIAVIGIAALAIITVALLLGGIIVWMLSRVQRTRSTAVAIAFIVVGIVVPPIILVSADMSMGITDMNSLVMNLIANVVTVVALLGATWSGVGAVSLWAVRRAWREVSSLGPLVARALPLMVVLVLFAYFSAETWQLGLGLTRWRVLGLIGLLGFLGTAVILVQVRGHLEGIDEEDEEEGNPWIREMIANPRVLQGTPWEGTDCKPTTEKWKFRERSNLIAGMLCAQMIQVTFLVFVVFMFLMILGLVAVPDTVLKTWLSNAPLPPAVNIFGAGLGPLQLKVSLIWAAFAGLSFSASLTVEPLYRKAFVHPLLHELAQSVAVRNAYIECLSVWEPEERTHHDN